MSEHSEQNRRAWDEVHGRRHESHGNSLGMDDHLRARLGPLTGRRVLHLQCATGETTAQLADAGGQVTAVDISAKALAIATTLAPGATFVESDVHDLPSDLRAGQFDLVVTEGGVLTWLHDLDTWASGIAAALRSGGELVLAEEHPVAACIDAELRWTDDYFDESVIPHVGWAHFELTGDPAVEPKHERFWRLGQIVTALAGAGLRIEELDEFPGGWRGTDPRVPGAFVLRATKP